MGLRTPFFVLALLLILVVVLLEIGSSRVLGGDAAAGAFVRESSTYVEDPPDANADEPPGRAIAHLALVDGLLLLSTLLVAASLVLSPRLLGRVQGVGTLIASILLVIAAVVMTIIAFVELLVMVALFMAPPFGTVAYLAMWGFFPRGDALALLGLLLFLKLCFGACLVLAHERFLAIKSLVLLVLTSLLLNVVIAFLHGLVPIVVVSIVDDIAALVVGIVGIVWALILLVGSIPAIASAVRVSTSAR